MCNRLFVCNTKILDYVQPTSRHAVPVHFIHCARRQPRLSEHVLSIGPVEVSSLLLQTGEVEEVRGAVHLVVELLGVAEGELVLHRGLVPDAHEVVVPRPLRRHHEEAEESKRGNAIKNVHQLKSIDGVKYQSIQPLQNVGQLGLFKAAG